MMKHLRQHIIAVLVLTLSASVATPLFAANLYKYKDNQGNVFHGTQVPPEYVKNGYEVINEKGQVIQVVERTLTAEERAAQADAIAAREQDLEAQQRQEEEDRLLLRLYRSPDEVIRRRDSTVEELDAQVTALSGLLQSAERRVTQLESTVESRASAGNEPPAIVLSQLEDATEERDRLARQVARIEEEKQETIETAEKNINRLKELLNLD